jgi:hypothetical protein
MRAFVKDYDQSRQRPSLQMTEERMPSSLAIRVSSSYVPDGAGNQARLRQLQQKFDDPKAHSITKEPARFAYDSGPMAVSHESGEQIPENLMTGSPGDIYEQEAERVSDRVMRISEPEVMSACVCGRADEKTHEGQTKRDESDSRRSSAISPVVLEALSSPAQPLDTTTRAFMERRFARNFGRVRIHANAKAAESASAVNALAYTVGRNVVFAAGQYAPKSPQGRRLLAHELVHVLQQEAASPSHEADATRLQRQPAPPPAQKDFWGFAKDIPANLHPHTPDDALTMQVIHYRFRQAVLLRHDFQTALRLSLGGRWLHKNVAWESDFAQGTATTSPQPPHLADLAKEHQKFKSDAKSDIASLQNADLAKLLSDGLEALFPEIGFSAQTGRALQVLAGAKSVLDRIELGAEGASLVRLLRRPRGFNAYYW